MRTANVAAHAAPASTADDQDLINLREAAMILHRGSKMVDALVRDGALEVVKTVPSGKRGRGERLVRRDDVEAIYSAMTERYTLKEAMRKLGCSYPEQVTSLVKRGLLKPFPPLPYRGNVGRTYDKEQVNRLASGATLTDAAREKAINALWKGKKKRERMLAMVTSWPRQAYDGVTRSPAGGRIYAATSLSPADASA